MAGTPELGTLGGLIRFAVSLEREAAAWYQAGVETAPAHPALSALAGSHLRRADQLERTLREQLNEMILEPITGLAAENYPSPNELVTRPDDWISHAIGIEQGMARLYGDIAGRAGRALAAAATRAMERLAGQCRSAADQLRAEAGNR